MLCLNNVTLICVDDTNDAQECYKKFNYVSNKINFFDCKFFSSKIKNCVLKNIKDITQYNKFIVNELNDHVSSEFCLIMQNDGYPVNIDSWDYNFLKCDYIGAPWVTQPIKSNQLVGNGGFSLRSKKFLEKSSKLNYDGSIPEDAFLCRHQDNYLKSEGLIYADPFLASKFSVENMSYGGQFGFHGKYTINLNKALGIFL